MKKLYYLWGIFFVLSSLFGLILGNLDFFGFFDGRHETSFLLLIGAGIISYFLTLTVFLLDCTENKRQSKLFVIASCIFAGLFAMSNAHILTIISATILFYIFLMSIYFEGKKRVLLYIKFSPKELFFPILKKGFLLLVTLFAVINFFATKTLAENHNVFSPAVIRTISRPFVLTFNKVLSDQIKGQLGNQAQLSINRAAKKQLIEYAVRETIRAMIQGKPYITDTINPDLIPVELLTVDDEGNIDVSPVVAVMSPDIATVVNNMIGRHITIAPFIIALFTLIIFQPLVLPLQFIEGFISLGIFSLLMNLHILSIKKEMKEVDRVVF